jgi:phosphoribosylanthranilate isomerase
MSLIIKICGLKDVRHVAAAVEAGADAIGFVFAQSVRRVTPELATAISSGVPRHIKKVAVMLHPDNDEWLNVLEKFSPDVLQTDAEDYSTLAVPESVERWPVYREGGAEPDARSTFVFEGSKSGQGETVDWTRAAMMAADSHMILAGGLSADNVGDAVATVRPTGVDVSSAVESAPGQKSNQLIQEFISAVRAAEKNL